MLTYCDKVIAEIGEKIAIHEPERGGALLGIPNSNTITCFLEDPSATISQTSYLPSQELTSKVQKVERAYGLVFKGVVHSHPGNLNAPSQQDSNAFAKGLSINPRLSGFVAPIVTLPDKSVGKAGNEISLKPQGIMTSYIAYRAKRDIIAHSSFSKHESYSRLNDKITIEPIDCSVMPVFRDCEHLTDQLQSFLGEVKNQADGYMQINGTFFISVTINFETLELVILFPPSYPLVKPFLLVSKKFGNNKSDAEELNFSWSLAHEGEYQLTQACRDKIISIMQSNQLEKDYYVT